MSRFFVVYMFVWLAACGLALLLLVRERASIEMLQRSYWGFLLRGWKIVTFLIAAICLVVMSPYTGDPTWDYIDATFMSILAFVTAPWVVGILYLFFRRRANWKKFYIAVCVWMFSGSWSYDLYLVIRDGYYPITWFPNIFASSVLYLSGGLFWSLEWRKGRGVHFGFTEADWPQAEGEGNFTRVVWYALPFIILVAAMIMPFLF